MEGCRLIAAVGIDEAAQLSDIVWGWEDLRPGLGRIPDGIGLCFHRHRVGWLPCIIMKYIFVWGAGYTPILYMMQHINVAPSSTGIVIHWDFLQNYFVKERPHRRVLLYLIQLLID